MPAPIMISSVNNGDPVTPNTDILITGSGFGVRQNNRLVIFGNVVMEVRSWSNNAIVVHVPWGVDNAPRLYIYEQNTNLYSNYVDVELTVVRAESMYTTKEALTKTPSSTDFSKMAPDDIDELIKDVSSEIDNYCNRPYGMARQIIVENLIGKGRDLICLRNYRGREARGWVFNVREIMIKSVELFPGIFAYTMTPDSVEIDPENATIHLKDSLLFKALGRNYFDIPGYTYVPANSLIRVVYEAGYADTPRDLKRACEMLLLRRLTQGSLNFTADSPAKVKVSKIEIEMARPVYGHRTLDDDIRALLDGYKVQSQIG